ncbi:MAG: DUF4983 domain-containing protein [Chitinophagaceae bacterium]|nr:MAG: DUF4983 domain-containing protein [Chitinophagaceae bacterium]
MKMSNKISIKTLSLAAVAAALAIFNQGCKKYADVPPFFEEIDSLKANAARKVLLIGIDGAVGSLVKDAALPNLTAMQEHSKFTFEAVSDVVTTDAASWKTLLTGVTYASHNVKDSSFAFGFTGDQNGHGAVKQYPSLFTNILSSEKPDLSTAIISPWSNLVKKLTPEVDNNYIATNDADAQDSTLKLLQKNVTPALTVINFNEAAIAGKNGGFSLTNSNYSSALTKIDGYIGAILNTLKARPGYNKSEEWMIIIASTHGGVNDTYGGEAPTETNTFMYIYNEKFKKLEFTKEGALYTTYINGKTTAAVRAVLNDPNAYDLSMAPITYQFKVKGVRAGNYPVFFSKKGPSKDVNVIRSADPGFAVIASNGSNGVQNFIRGTGSSSPGAGLTVFDNTWHDVAFTYSDSISKRWAMIYVDGVLASTQDITGAGSSWAAFKSTEPLMFGYKQADYQDPVNAYYADIRVFNKALSGDEIRDNLCVQNPLANHSSKANIIGYWPCNEGFGNSYKNLAPAGAGKDFILENKFSWTLMDAIPCTFPSSPAAGKLSKVLYSVDVAPIMMYWLGVNVKGNWNWQGNASWLSDYEVEFLQ